MKNITAEELKKRMENEEDFLLLDVRTPGEYNEFHIKGAKLIPLSDLQERAGELDKEEDTVVYCRSGARSSFAAQILEQLGFKKISNLIGGTNSWESM